jgi:ribosomal-protein-alanine N-acetyltransferase
MTFSFSTDRLRIRPWSRSDRGALARMTGDADMMRYLSQGQPWSDERIDELAGRIDAHRARHGISFGALEWRASGEVVGLSGLQQLDSGEFELGWWIWKDYWGQGLAIEGTRPFVDHARDAMGLDRLVAVIDPGNAASRRVAEKLGMSFEGIKSARETMAMRPDEPIAFYAMALGRAGETAP